jgi:hypothetical protein
VHRNPLACSTCTPRRTQPGRTADRGLRIKIVRQRLSGL